MNRNLSQKTRVCSALALVVSLAACTNPTSPLEGTTTGNGQSASPKAEGGIPAWVAHPEVLPAGHQGKNNCTFGSGGQWDAHPEGGCWEHPGPDGWTREQRNANHFESLAACGGGPGDVAQIRVCRLGGEDQISPCDGATTGPLGCAVCVNTVTCH